MIAAVQGIALLGYAVFDVVEAFRVGLTGPAEVSNPMALLLLIVLTAAGGVGLLWVAVGWWRSRSWARSPFVFSQLVVGLIGLEVAQSAETAQRAVGITAMALAGAGLVLAFLPSVARGLSD